MHSKTHRFPQKSKAERHFYTHQMHSNCTCLHFDVVMSHNCVLVPGAVSPPPHHHAEPHTLCSPQCLPRGEKGLDVPTCVCVCMYVCMYVYSHIHAYVCVYVTGALADHIPSDGVCPSHAAEAGGPARPLSRPPALLGDAREAAGTARVPGSHHALPGDQPLPIDGEEVSALTEDGGTEVPSGDPAVAQARALGADKGK